jgi:hypothetical protein
VETFIAMNEKNVINEILLLLSKFKMGCFFRNNTGVGWAGKASKIGNDVFIKDARPLRAGLINGSSDIIGWHPMKITPEMVGKTISVFVAIEVKADKSRPKENQLNFIEQVRKAGGIAGIANVPEDALAILKSNTKAG